MVLGLLWCSVRVAESIPDLKDSNIRESRDPKVNLNYLSGQKKLKEIYDCEVIDLSSDLEKKVKIKDII